MNQRTRERLASADRTLAESRALLARCTERERLEAQARASKPVALGDALNGLMRAAYGASVKPPASR